MINHFAQVSLYKDGLGKIVRSKETKKSFVLSYPCDDNKCTPYVLKLKPSVYKFECWGSSSQEWIADQSKSIPGFGGYTSGFLYVHHPTTFYVYVGQQGFFNTMKGKEDSPFIDSLPGGATDVRLNASENWWDTSSLISRIMVAAGAGAAEWGNSIGGHGGGIEGGNSSYRLQPCAGATQISGSKCDPILHNQVLHTPSTGSFGSAGIIEPVSTNDYGAIGGGGYYGGTSYPYTFAGSGGSSFISGHEGCDAVKEQIDPIEHTGQPNHYSGFVFKNTEMISGNNSMPVPTSLTERRIYKDLGAFRLTLIYYQYHCTCQKATFRLIPFTLLIFSK